MAILITHGTVYRMALAAGLEPKRPVDPSAEIAIPVGGDDDIVNLGRRDEVAADRKEACNAAPSIQF